MENKVRNGFKEAVGTVFKGGKRWWKPRHAACDITDFLMYQSIKENTEMIAAST